MIKKGDQRIPFIFFGGLFFGFSLMFTALSTAIPMFSNAFVLTIILSVLFLIGGVSISFLWELNKKLDTVNKKLDTILKVS